MNESKLREEWKRFITDHARAIGTLNEDLIDMCFNFWLSKLSSQRKYLQERVELMAANCPPVLDLWSRSGHLYVEIPSSTETAYRILPESALSDLLTLLTKEHE